jgi:hypothetical protein
MGALFSKPKTQGPDPEIERKRKEAEDKAAATRAEEEARAKEDNFQTGAGQRGSRALLSQGFGGFSTELFRPTKPV